MSPPHLYLLNNLFITYVCTTFLLSRVKIEHLLVQAPCKGFPFIVAFDLCCNLPVRTMGIIAKQNLMFYSKSLNCGSRLSLSLDSCTGSEAETVHSQAPTSISLFSLFPLCRMRQHPPAQSTGSRRRRPRQRRCAATLLRLAEVNVKHSRRMKALKHPPHLPPQAPASRPAASPAGPTRVRGARGYALASAR